MFGLRVAYTPGHASHHVSYLHEDSGWAFVGDVAGVRIPPVDHTLMPTPPPDIDVEAWLDSIATVEAWSPGGDRASRTSARTRTSPPRSTTPARSYGAGPAWRASSTRTRFGERFHADLAEHVDDEQVLAAITQASDPRLEYAGLARYWRKLGNDRHPA